MLTYQSLWHRPGKTPVTNRGLNSQSAIETTVDTLSIIFDDVRDSSHCIGLAAKLEDFYGERLELRLDRKMRSGQLWDGGSISSVRGMSLYWQAPTCGRPGKVKVNIGGRLLKSVTQRENQLFILGLAEDYQGRASRMDVAIDDFSRSLDFGKIQVAIDRGDCFGFRWVKDITSGFAGSERRGRTIYMGSPDSLKTTRVYDKTVESDGEIDSIRMELQLRDEYADIVFQGWLRMSMDSDKQVSDWLSSMVLGSVDFRQRIDKNRDRCPLLDWWTDFIKLVETTPQRLSIPKKEGCLVRTMDAIEHQYGAMLATIESVLGATFDNWLQQIKESGKERMGSRHRALAGLARDEYAIAYTG